MLLFSTILDIEKSLTKDSFIKLVIEWNQGSPHESNIIRDISWSGERNVRYGNERLWMDIEEYKDIIAVRFEKTDEDGAVWDSDYVMNFQEMKMSIRLDRSYLEEALTIDPKFSTPHFITLLIERGYVKDDGNLAILKKPVLVDNSNFQVLADVVNEKAMYRLPVVYISKTYHDEDPVNVNLLASRLKGVAHVLVQKSNCTNSSLKTLCSEKNEYYGAIGIYFPRQAMHHRRYLYRHITGIDNHLLEKVVQVVIQYSNSQMIETLYTWQGVNNALLRDSLFCQKEKRAQIEEERRKTLYELLQLKGNIGKMQQKALEDAKMEADRILDGFEEDMRKLQNQIEQLSRENDALTSELYGLRSKMNSIDRKPIIFLGDEDEFYTGEIKEMILDAIEDALKRVTNKTRRFDVLNDILEKNMYEKIREERERTIKNMFKDYKTLSATLRQELKDLGFEITEDGKHYRLTYYGDDRYKTTIAKTGSDWREGKNIAATILKNMM